ncbi:hypothetical protein [Pantoea sp.]|jgi:hypothetical protein|uniref:hypothetical protein n=1 Tax=Pantoea sp. TaxID=69393 RepID=UPI00137935B4|nr:hypothetical protein [Pantoea sp.]MDU5474914.1 hypothetical protein [Pantoea sp.]
MMGSSVCHRRGKYTASCGLLAKSSAEKKALHQQHAEKKSPTQWPGFAQAHRKNGITE